MLKFCRCDGFYCQHCYNNRLQKWHNRVSRVGPLAWVWFITAVQSYCYIALIVTQDFTVETVVVPIKMIPTAV